MQSPSSTPIDYEAFRKNKTIPSVLEKEILHALSYYPELKDTTICFVFKQKIRGSVMQAQPRIGSMFGNNRAYHINISAMFKLTHSAIPIHQIPPDVITGWIGHELGHVMDYQSRNLLEMIRFGLGYLFSAKYVKKAERVADMYAVNHGLGNYILKTKHFILDHALLSERYKQKIARLYLSPDDIVEEVKKLESERILPTGMTPS